MQNTLSNLLDNFDIHTFQAMLLSWYQDFGRKDLPWRILAQKSDTSSKTSISKALKENPNIPYLVYISEIMLQQTQVSTVLPYFQRFIKHFPTLAHLANAKEQEVLTLWSGLGYYSRARNILKTAKVCAQECQNKNLPIMLPNQRELLKKLSGIGDYSSGAIACFGFGMDEGFWDGNIKRILSRLFAIPTPSKKELDFLSNKLLNHANAYEHNQALLDLGSLICKKLPHCNLCPINSMCQGKTSPTSYDIRPKKSYTEVSLHLLLPYQNNYFALFKDRRYGLLYTPLEIGCEIKDSGKIFYNHQSYDLSKLQKLGSFKHTRTHYKITATVYQPNNENLSIFKDGIGFDSLEWVDDKAPLSALAKKSLMLFNKQNISTSATIKSKNKV